MRGLCTWCLGAEPERNKVLREIAHSKDRSVQDLLRQAKQNTDSSLQERAAEHARERLEERMRRRAEYEKGLKEREEQLSHEASDSLMQGEEFEALVECIVKDQLRQQLEQEIRQLRREPEGISAEDIESSLEEYQREGYIDIEEGRVRITSKGARALAKQALKTILEHLRHRELGAHDIEKMGYSMELAVSSRKYEVGDEYSQINIERTLINALERVGSSGRLALDIEDFEVQEEVYQTKLCAGLIIDESGSMKSNHKINAAMDASLALTELISREPRDKLRVMIFSEEVKEIQPWDVVNANVPMRCTDIRAAMRSFRHAVMNEMGDKQAYLITDTEPNYEDGRYVGFNQAVTGVIQEASRFRQQGITLNIIMLDQSPYLKELASILARRNLGRVFFASPENLGQIMLEDYLTSRKGRLKARA